jgi:hypothetical protein
MTEIRISCDRCGQVVLQGRTLLRVESGPLRGRYSEVDLCPDCVRWLVASLAEGKPRNET